MTRKIWWCDNCGYEVTARGRCSGCGERLLPGRLPELVPREASEEVGYGLEGWDPGSRGRLIEALYGAGIVHRFDGDELVVLKDDEWRVDAITAQILARKVWLCRQCGSELRSPGRCAGCGGALIASPLPELDDRDDCKEVSYTISGWGNAMRVRLIDSLLQARVLHRFEDDELVVQASDQTVATEITGRVVDEANQWRPLRKYKDLSPLSDPSFSMSSTVGSDRAGPSATISPTTEQPVAPVEGPRAAEANPPDFPTLARYEQRPASTLTDGSTARYDKLTLTPEPGVSTWGPLWLSVLLPPIGFAMAIWRLVKHYGSYREVIALGVSGAQLLVAIIALSLALASPVRPANGGFYNTSVLAQSVKQTLNQHYLGLGMGTHVKSVRCVLDFGSTYTCALHETQSTAEGNLPLTIPITVVVSDNGNEWKSS